MVLDDVFGDGAEQVAEVVRIERPGLSLRSS
jgi:hypothetical protein